MKLNIQKIFTVTLILLLLSACSDNTESDKVKTIASDDKPISNFVSVTGGTIRGNAREDGLIEYLGIPYAAPPIGERRWQSPAPLAAWKGEHDSTSFGLPCYQPGSLSAFYDRTYKKMSEDCLTLNVWTRAEQTSDALPVMVWIHGGALVMGSGMDYDGSPLTRKGVILVTINYRLGPFGFYAHPALSAEGKGHSGNQGYKDQIAALNWVQENIRQFGGDPNNVTIFGESAGSWSMSVMQASPMARGLFDKIIGQSGARFVPLPDLKKARWGMPSAEERGETLASMFAQTDAPDLDVLRTLSAESIIGAYAADPALLFDFDSLTIVDGQVLPEEVNTIFDQGRQADVPVMIGSNADEATTFDPAIGATSPIDYVELHTQFVDLTLGGDKRKALLLYPDTPEFARDSYIRFNTDANFTQPMRQWANYMDNVSSEVYLYWWNWRPVINGSDEYASFHAAEIPYVFGDLAMFNIEVSEREEAFSETMMTIWTNFAKNSNPSSKGIINWPAYAEDKPMTAVLGADIGLEGGVRSEQVRVITAGYDARRD